MNISNFWMQAGAKPLQRGTNKPTLLVLIVAAVVGVMAPLTLPQVTHPSMIYHIVLHMAGITIAAFLSLISITAYRRAGGARTLFMTTGFIALGIIEVLYLMQAAALPTPFYIPSVNIEAAHIFTLIVLTMFGMGVLKANK